MVEENDLRSADGSERSSAEIRDDIAARRESITQTVDRLGERIHETLDWKGHVARHPYASVGVAIGAGLILSGFFKRKASPSERITNALVDTVEELGNDLRISVRKLILRAAVPSLFRGALYGLAGKALIQYLQNRGAHVEGNGSNPSGGAEWRDPQHTTSMPDMS